MRLEIAVVTIPINTELLKTLIMNRYGSIDDFAVAWEARVEEKRQSRGHARDRNTIYRWLKVGIPSQEEDLFGICAALDVDPVALLPLSKPFIAKTFPKERLRLQINPSRKSDLAPFDPIFMPGIIWPSNEVSNGYYQRDWLVEVREHNPSVISGEYAAFNLFTDSEHLEPRVFHFAWQRTNSLDDMWRPYGSVIRRNDQVQLVSESGDFQTVFLGSVAELTVVETYFGAGPATFCVASLHPFSLSVEVPSQATHAVRFEG